MLAKRNRFFNQLMVLIDGLITLFSCFVAFWLRFQSNLIPQPYAINAMELIFQVSLIYLFLNGLFSFIFKIYEAKRATPILSEIWKIIQINAISLLILSFFVFFFKLNETSRVFVLLIFLVNTLFISSFRLSLRIFLRRARKVGYNLRHTLIVGTGEIGQKVHEKIHEILWSGYRVVGFIDDDTKSQNILGTKVLGGISDMPKIIQKFKIDSVFVALSQKNQSHFKRISDILDKETVRLHLVPDIFQYNLLLNYNITSIDDLPVLSLRESPLYGYKRILKRLFDITFSFLVLLLGFPLFLAIAIAVKISSPGPIFYSQERTGLDGESFNMLKFRSMPVNSESKTGAVWAAKGDNRATKVGSFLRKTSLDELPQFINVFFGDMSVVGPRPERPVFIDKFKEEVPGYMMRHLMKSGITGWAQVHGWRGNTSIKKRIEHDLFYINNWSFALDIRIIFMTLWKGFVNENAY